MMKNKKVIVLLVVVIIVAIVIYLKADKKDTTQGTEKIEGQEKNTVVEYLNTINIEDEKITNEEDDEIALKVKAQSKGSISNMTVTKTGDSSDLTLSDKMGRNSAIQVNISSDITIEDIKVKTNGKGASGVVATGNNSVINISDSTIETNKERSKGLLVSNGGTIRADNVTITTEALKSSAVATDFGKGIIEITESTIKCSGEKSAGVYATSTVNVKNSKIESKQAEGAVIDGSGTITLTDVKITTNGRKAVMIYYTGPKVEDAAKGTFTMTKGSITAKGENAFYIMNTKAEINLEDVEMKSEIFLKASVDEYGELGQEGKMVESKGGEAIVNCVKQTIKGDILVDNQSMVELNLTEKSKYTGAINNANTGKKVMIKLDSNSKLSLTGNSYITSLENEDTKNSNIDFNGYKLYVNGTAIN